MLTKMISCGLNPLDRPSLPQMKSLNPLPSRCLKQLFGERELAKMCKKNLEFIEKQITEVDAAINAIEAVEAANY